MTEARIEPERGARGARAINKWFLSKSKLAKLRPQHELTVLLSLRESSHARTQHALRAPLLSKLSAAALLSSPHFLPRFSSCHCSKCGRRP